MCLPANKTGQSADVELSATFSTLRSMTSNSDETVDAQARLEAMQLLKILEAWNRGTLDVVSQSLKCALQAINDRRVRVRDDVLSHLTLALKDHLGAQELKDIKCPPPRGGLAPWQANLAKRLILQQMDTNISTSALAKACNLSRGHFTRSFKQTVGVPPHRWLQARRIERAKELLSTDGRPLADVAVMCGFTDQAHFSRVFKIMTDHTPFSWRRIARPDVYEHEDQSTCRTTERTSLVEK